VDLRFGHNLHTAGIARQLHFSYNGAGQVSQVDEPTGVTVTFRLRPGRQSDPLAARFSGRTVTSVYGAGNRLMQRSFTGTGLPDARLDLSYDLAGYLIGISPLHRCRRHLRWALRP